MVAPPHRTRAMGDPAHTFPRPQGAGTWGPQFLLRCGGLWCKRGGEEGNPFAEFLTCGSSLCSGRMWFSLLVQLFLMLDVNAVRIAFDFHFSKTGQWRLPGAEPGDVQRVQPVNWVACSDSASPDASWGDVVQGFCTRGLFLMHGVYAASASAGRYRGGRDSPKEVYVLSFDSTAPRALSFFRLRLCLLLAVVAGMLTPQAMLAAAEPD